MKFKSLILALMLVFQLVATRVIATEPSDATNVDFTLVIDENGVAQIPEVIDGIQISDQDDSIVQTYLFDHMSRVVP